MAQQAIFITGASSGIGLASALHLRDRGFIVLAGVLPGEDTTALTVNGNDQLTILPIDISKPDMIYAARDVIVRTVSHRGLFGLLNNAGIAEGGPIEFLPIELLRRMLDVNLIGHVQVTQALLPLIRASQGRIVNVTSILGRVVATPFGGPYSMTKYAMEAFTDTLRLEMRPFGVSVSAVEPGTIKTPIWGKARANFIDLASELPPEADSLYGAAFRQMVETTQKTGEGGISPDHVARAIVHAFTAPRPKTRYRVGADAKTVDVLKRLLTDRAFDRLLRWRYPSSGD
jgi:NAD(P)-dependent dehydrogenase (short-subunit alcohol dehydrogenase family)